METIEKCNLHEQQLVVLVCDSKTQGNFDQKLENIFQQYFKTHPEQDFRMNLEEFINLKLPSDKEIRLRTYFKLVDQKRMSMLTEEKPENVKMHDWNIIPKTTQYMFSSPVLERLRKEVSMLYGPNEISWTLTDIAKSSCILSSPPKKVDFMDDQEMRRVYTLIYDVFRHKNILITALDDCSFFGEYGVLNNVRPKVWLLFFDLYHRHFKHRDMRQKELATKIFTECNIWMIEEALWKQRIHLAAAVARMRIKNNALNLSDLLPKHLRDDRVSYSQLTPVTCWVNVNKIKNFDEITNQLKTLLNVNPQVDEKSDLQPDKFIWDTVCPHFLILHSSIRKKLTQSVLVQKHKLILQDRSFCIGPAAFDKIVGEMQLKGSVIQSHIHSPRSTAYLANLLSRNGKITKLFVFSAGNRKLEYDDYLNKLGTKNVTVFSEKLYEFNNSNNINLEEASAVFAAPPNSYSAVSDPIDLVCSRGGDLNLLEILTETELTSEGKKRIKNILDEQKKTLQFAMAKPQIQVVMYETHSEIDAENNQMVNKTLEYINKVTQLKHAVVQGKISISDLPSDTFSITKNEIRGEKMDKYMDHDKLVKKYFELESISSVSLLSNPTSQNSLNDVISNSTLKEVAVPPCDLFVKPNLPDISPKLSSFTNLRKQGCYLAVIQRKKITHVDNEYMIEVAENRGLFGKKSSSTDKAKRNRKNKKRSSDQSSKVFKRNIPIDISKIAAPTMSFKRFSDDSAICPRSSKKLLTYSKDFEEMIEITSKRHQKINQKLQELKNAICNPKMSTPKMRLEAMNRIRKQYSEISKNINMKQRNAREKMKRKMSEYDSISTNEETEINEVKLTDEEIQNVKRKYQNPFELMRIMTKQQMKTLIRTPLVGNPTFNELAMPVRNEDRKRRAIKNILKENERTRAIVAKKLSIYSKPRKKIFITSV